MVFCIWLSLVICVGLISIKVYWKLTTKWNGSYTCLVGKTAIVTGANTGLGYITALDLAKRGARVILACRNRERAEEAQRKISKTTDNKNVYYKLVDMASLRSVREFAEDINKTEERLDILVNNAGVGYLNEEYTADGIQYVLHSNHIGPFLLTHLLIGKLKDTGSSRIVNVASMAARRSKLTLSNLDQINEVPAITISKLQRDITVYSTSKLCNILFTIELAKRLDGTDVITNTLHPGVIYTDFFRGIPGMLRKVFAVVGSTLLMSPEEGAQTQIYLAVSKDVEGISGGLFANCTQIELYATARNLELAKKLWEKSEELAKLKVNEKI